MKSLVRQSLPQNSTPAEVNVEHHAERSNGAEQAKQHIKSAFHAQRFGNANTARGQAAENCKTHDGFGTRTALGCDGPIFCLCLCVHKCVVMFDVELGPLFSCFSGRWFPEFGDFPYLMLEHK